MQRLVINDDQIKVKGIETSLPQKSITSQAMGKMRRDTSARRVEEWNDMQNSGDNTRNRDRQENGNSASPLS